jgi:hypothetical protein
MTDPDRRLLEKEIQGLKAKLKWDHISEGVKFGYALRIAELEKKLKDLKAKAG